MSSSGSNFTEGSSFRVAIEAIVAVAEKEKSPQEAQLFRNLSKQLKFAVNDEERKKLILAAFADSYAEGRTKSLLSTSKSAALTAFEDAIIAAFGIAKIKNAKNEELIFVHALTDATARAHLVDHLFLKGMAAGLGNETEMTFVNSVKAIVRMGNEAIKQWNAKLGQMVGSDAFALPLNTEEKGELKRLTESQIEKIYKILKVDKSLREKIKERFPTDMLIDLLKNSSQDELNADQKNRLNNLVLDLQRVKADDHRTHTVFMDAYLDAYVNEREKGTFGTKKGKLLQYLEKTVTQYELNTSSKMFVGPTEGTIKEKQKDAEILGSVDTKYSNDEGRLILVNKSIAMALESAEKKDEKSFVNVIKAMVRMDHGKVFRLWETMIREKGYDPLSLTSGGMTGGSYDENFIHDMYSKVAGKELKELPKKKENQNASSSASLISQHGINAEAQKAAQAAYDKYVLESAQRVTEGLAKYRKPGPGSSDDE